MGSLSHFAQIYGPLPGKTFSGLTPVVDVPRHKPRPNEQLLLEREKYQREKFLGFTSQELVQLDVITNRELKVPNLQNAIHRIMQYDRWEGPPPFPRQARSSLMPLIGGNGYWTVQNQPIWTVLKPILKLASRSLVSVHLLPWFDALINGERRPIPPDRAVPGEDVNDLFSYHVPPTVNPEVTAIVRNEILETLRVKFDLRFYFMSPFESPSGVLFTLAGSTTGMSILYQQMPSSHTVSPKWTISIFISTDRLQSLLRNDLGPSQRQLLEWEVANTILHEMMHAIQMSHSPALPMKAEPFFEQSSVSEVGFDYEVSMHGGFVHNMLPKVGYVPIGYWVDTTYPAISHGSCSTCPKILINPAPPDEKVQHPVPVTFYEDAHQEEFWNVGIRMFGFPLLHYRFIREGARVKYKSFFNYVTRRFQWSNDGQAVRLSGDLPFPIPWNTFQDKLAKLGAIMDETPYQRAATAFGQQIVRSAKEQNIFWTNFNMQEDRVKQIITQSTGPGPNSEQERVEMTTKIVELLGEAVCHHHNMTVSVINLEQDNSITRVARRDRLLGWNRGCRQFIKELLVCCTPGRDDANIANLERNLLQLEVSRMEMYDPLEGPHDVEDRVEFQDVLMASNNAPVVQHDICTKILANLQSSLFGTCCADIMICGLRAHIQNDWEQRRDMLQKHIDTFAQLQKENVRHWIAPIRDWGMRAERVRDLIVQNHGAAGHAQGP